MHFVGVYHLVNSFALFDGTDELHVCCLEVSVVASA